MKKIIFMLLAIVALTGCSKFEQVPDVNDENGTPVELYGEIDGATTRGAGVIDGAVPAGGLHFDLFRANQTPEYTTYTVKVDGILGAETDHLTTITTDPKLYYLGNGSYSSFIGLYPRVADATGAEFSPADNTVTYEIDGGTDILATESFEGKKSDVDHPTTATLTFQHLLTKIRVDIKVGGDPEAVISAVGKITAIKVKEKAVKAIVTFPTPTVGTIARPTIDVDDTDTPDNLPLVNATDGTAISATALNPDGTTAVPIGVAMFLPTSVYGATEDLKLIISTEESNPDQYEVNVPNRTFAQGSSYIITIKVTENGLGLIEFSLVNVTSSIAGWTPVTPTPEEEIEY
jgi:hypothetical protein